MHSQITEVICKIQDINFPFLLFSMQNDTYTTISEVSS